jgi:8-oxo-dGTP pyrophosphatase MutT (NUDIX family)
LYIDGDWPHTTPLCKEEFDARAAGLLPITHNQDDGSVWCLLVEEYETKESVEWIRFHEYVFQATALDQDPRQRWQRQWNPLSGKRKENENALETAVREAKEETLGVIDIKPEELLSSGCVQVWSGDGNGFSKMLLFAYYVPWSQHKQSPHLFQQRLHTARAQGLPETRTPELDIFTHSTQLQWFQIFPQTSFPERKSHMLQELTDQRLERVWTLLASNNAPDICALSLEEPHQDIDKLMLQLQNKPINEKWKHKPGKSTLTQPRPLQAALREHAIDRDRHCVVTGFSNTDLLDAVHIRARADNIEVADFPANILLLRCDIHKLFDKGHLVFRVDDMNKVTVHICSPDAEVQKEYGLLHGRDITPNIRDSDSKKLLRALQHEQEQH